MKDGRWWQKVAVAWKLCHVFANTFLVASAGNDFNEGCGFPADSDLVISVGNHDINFDAASSSQYGDCVDVWGPGTDVTLATASSDTDYRPVTGTSFASPYVAGVIVNWLLECPL